MNSSIWRSASRHTNSSFSFSRLGVSWRMTRCRWSRCVGRVHGGELVAEGQLVAVLVDQLAHVVRPSSGTGKPGNGPVTELHEEKVSVSVYTAQASS